MSWTTKNLRFSTQYDWTNCKKYLGETVYNPKDVPVGSFFWFYQTPGRLVVFDGKTIIHEYANNQYQLVEALENKEFQDWLASAYEQFAPDVVYVNTSAREIIYNVSRSKITTRDIGTSFPSTGETTICFDEHSKLYRVSNHSGCGFCLYVMSRARNLIPDNDDRGTLATLKLYQAVYNVEVMDYVSSKLVLFPMGNLLPDGAFEILHSALSKIKVGDPPKKAETTATSKEDAKLDTIPWDDSGTTTTTQTTVTKPVEQPALIPEKETELMLSDLIREGVPKLKELTEVTIDIEIPYRNRIRRICVGKDQDYFIYGDICVSIMELEETLQADVTLIPE